MHFHRPGAQEQTFMFLLSEDPALDDAIREEGISDTASYVYGFSGGLEMESTTDLPKISDSGPR